MPTLRLRTRSGRVLEREFGSWSELLRAKNLIKPFASWDSASRTWVLGYCRDADACARAVSEAFGIAIEEAKAVVHESNEAIVAERLAALGSDGVVILEKLSDEEFHRLSTFGDYVPSARGFRWNPAKAVRRLGARAVEEARNLVKWVEECPKLVAFPDSLQRLVKDVEEELRRRLVVRAEAFTLENGNGRRRRVWIRLVFPDRVPNEVFEALKDYRHVPFYRVVFEEGEKTLVESPFRAVFFRFSERTIEIAPFLLPIVEEALRRLGMRIEPQNFELPKAEPVIEVGRVPELWEFQKEALGSWSSRSFRGCVVLPTGAGKTYVALGAVAMLRVPTAIFVPTYNLVEQWREKLVKVLGVPEHMIGVLGAGRHEVGKPVLIAIYDSAVERAWDIGQRYALYIFDEGHHVAANTYREIAWHMLAPFRLTLTATLERDDGNHEMIHAMCGPVVYSKSYRELVEGGYVAPVSVTIIAVPIHQSIREKWEKLVEEYEEVRKGFAELARALGLAPGDSIRDAARAVGGAVWERYRELNSRALSILSRMRVLEQRNPAKDAIAIELAAKMVSEGRQVFVFTNLIDQATKIFEELRKRLGPRVALVTGETSPESRDAVFRRFRSGEVKCVVTTTVLDEGVDAPSADAAIIVSSRALKNPRQYIQRIGRVVRKGEGKRSVIVILRTKGRFENSTIRALRRAIEEVYGVRPMIVDAEKSIDPVPA